MLPKFLLNFCQIFVKKALLSWIQLLRGITQGKCIRAVCFYRLLCSGTAKTPSNSGVISLEYREIWERYARYVSSLTNKQTKWMKCQVTGNQIKEEKLEICIKSVYRYERKKERTREITSFLSMWVISSKSKSNSTNFLPR